jgi:tRNA(Ile)-lysidine synthase
MALLWLAWRCASGLRVRTVALHVDHGLQPASAAWPGLIADEAARWSEHHPRWPPIELRVRRLSGSPVRGQSVEAWAREGRYRALQEMTQELGIDLLLLAHHQQDQAETFILQALRGAGPQGLAGMPILQWRHGVCWARPLLRHDRSALASLASQAGLRCVEDLSNQDPQWARNRLRQAVWPALVAAFPEAQTTLVRAAQRCAQALETLEQGIQADRHNGVLAVTDEGRRWRLNESGWRALSPARRSQLLREWWASQGIDVPSSLVDRLAADDWPAGGMRRWSLDARHELRGYRGELVISPRTALPTQPKQGLTLVLRWTRAGTKRAAAWGGRLALRRAPAGAAGAAMDLPCTLQLRGRRGDDQFQLQPGGTARSLKKQFQTRAVPAWDRHGPVVADGNGVLMWVPGLGWDARVPLVAGGWQLEWIADAAEQAASSPHPLPL